LITSKQFWSTLLILAVTVLVLPSMASSQSLTTITSLTTVTRQTTSTSYRTVAVRTTTATATSAIYTQETFTVQGVKPRECFGIYFVYDALAGEKLQGKWTSNYVINFYVMSESSHKQFKHCGQPGPTYITVEMERSYSLNWVVPTDGTVYFEFENYASGSDIASARTVTFELYKVGPTTQVVYSTTSAHLTLGATATLRSVSYSTIHSPLEGITQPLPLTAIGVIAGILAVVAIVAIPKRQKRAVPPKPTEPSEPKEEKRFCINCGAELPFGSKFCNKCGVAQS
jgi:hypothetical protein